VVSDSWEGLDTFFEPGREILTASSCSDVVDILNLEDEELRRVGEAARERVLEEHTADHRSKELIRLLEVSA
jgi:spore maturation protein CgeB